MLAPSRRMLLLFVLSHQLFATSEQTAAQSPTPYRRGAERRQGHSIAAPNDEEDYEQDYQEYDVEEGYSLEDVAEAPGVDLESSDAIDAGDLLQDQSSGLAYPDPLIDPSLWSDNAHDAGNSSGIADDRYGLTARAGFSSPSNGGYSVPGRYTQVANRQSQLLTPISTRSQVDSSFYRGDSPVAGPLSDEIDHGNCGPNGCDSGSGWGESCFGQRLLVTHLGAVFLHRSQPRNDLLILNPFNPVENLNARDFDLGWGYGVDAGLTLIDAFSPGNDLEVRYWGINDWSDQQFLQATGPTTQINSNPPTLVAGAQDVTARMSTELHSFEANWRHRSEATPISLIFGFRAIELYDRFDASFVDPNGLLPTAALHVKTRNHLYGLQGGLEAPIYSDCRLCIKGFTKAALLGNALSNNDLYRCNCAIPNFYRVNDSSDRLSYLSEAGLTGRLDLGNSWWLTAQYQALWLGGVATATDQIPNANFVNGTGLNSRGGILYHGGMIGIEKAF